MNQKYLQGISSNMRRRNEAVFFEATPENISAFLMKHQTAQMSAIGTVDEKSFLTARFGFINICPDQEYLAQKLLPIYSKVQMGIAPKPPLKKVPRELALAEKCPRPDWNYLRWDGYSDKKYQAICNGEGLLELCRNGKKMSLELQVRSYYNGGALSLLLVDWSSGEPEPWGRLTTNLCTAVGKDHALIDVNNLGEDILPWIEENGLGKPTGHSERRGFAVYPEYRFDAERLRELDDYGYQEYSRILEAAARGQRQQKQKRQER